MRLGATPRRRSSSMLDRPLSTRHPPAPSPPKVTERKAPTVAKDKSKTKDKADKPGKGGGKLAGGFANPSEAPAGSSDGWKAEHVDNIGKLFLITPLREEELETDYGRKPAVFADVVVVNVKNPAKSEAYENVAFWGGWTRGSLRGFIGERRVLAVLEQGEPRKKSESAPWILADANAKQVEAATAYLDSLDPLR